VGPMSRMREVHSFDMQVDAAVPSKEMVPSVPGRRKTHAAPVAPQMGRLKVRPPAIGCWRAAVQEEIPVQAMAAEGIRAFTTSLNPPCRSRNRSRARRAYRRPIGGGPREVARAQNDKVSHPSTVGSPSSATGVDAHIRVERDRVQAAGRGNHRPYDAPLLPLLWN